jgi:signal transduction histidine kinase
VNDEEMDFLSKEGNQISGILSLTAQKDKEGRVYMQGIIHDITNLRKAEVAKLQIEKLGAAGRLTRILAHEIRNPLNNINLSVEQINHEDKTGQSKMFIDIINRNSQTINNLISQLLTSALPTETSLKENSLELILDAAIAQAIDRIKLKKIELGVSYPDSPSIILADANKLRIAFLNIIINSIEAMDGTVNELNIRIAESAQNYIVTIQDTGTGIDEEHLSRLFEPYFTSKKNGMGLGLASTLNILQSHHAQAEVKSKLGQGTSFFIRFKKSTQPEN